jgi:hypothetical protein
MPKPTRSYCMIPPHTADVWDDDALVRPLRHIVYHSPMGYSWGYGGSGPADLALSILADHFNELQYGAKDWTMTRSLWLRRVERSRAWALHHDFKCQVVAQHDRDEPWRIDADEIENWLALCRLSQEQSSQ